MPRERFTTLQSRDGQLECRETRVVIALSLALVLERAFHTRNSGAGRRRSTAYRSAKIARRYLNARTSALREACIHPCLETP
jgi:hypothetical protein